MALTRTGTQDINSLLAANFTSAARFGLDTIAQVLANDMAVHNEIVRQMVSEFLETTEDRQRITGASTTGRMIETDEYGRAPTQRPVLGSTVGFPLKKYQYPIGWTREWLEEKTPRDMALAQINAQKAHQLELERQVKRAIYPSANYAFPDHLVDGITLSVKRFSNADGVQIGDGPNGEVYDGTVHTHYIANATLTTAALTSVINTVVEHGFGGRVRVAFNAADEVTVRALTGFQPYIDARLTLNTAANQPNDRLDYTRLNNRPIGIYGAAEIWIKPWAIANYAFVWDDGAVGKPLVLRERQPGSSGLSIAAEIDAFPLHAQYMVSKFGIGVWTRSNGAVLQFNNGTYVDPVIS
jgi:hypothetical protein